MNFNPDLIRQMLLAASALIFCALTGCSSTPTKVDSGNIEAATFNFVIPGPRTTPAYADKAQPVHGVIQDAITRNLASRGVKRLESGGDVTIGYLLIIGNNATTRSINDYFGYGDSSELEARAHEIYSGNKNPNYFEAGTLVIDIVDSKTFKLLKRGYASRPLLQNPSAEARAARVQEVVDEILKDLRVGA
jgi:hypothetical protein